MAEHVQELSKPAEKIPWLRMLFDQGAVTQDIVQHRHEGLGTPEDPYVVKFLGPDDPRDPMNFTASTRWTMCAVVSLVTLSVAFLSSAYSAGIPQIEAELGGSSTLQILGVSLFVLGFAFGPFLFAPLSELYGRQRLFWFTYSIHTAFNAAACGAQNLATLLILRFLAGTFGSAPLTTSGGVIADSFPAADRGLALQIFTLGPLFGPILGPIVGGFVAERVGWRWLMGVMAIFPGVLFVIGVFTVPETYAPVLLRQRAARLSKLTGMVYEAHGDVSADGKRTKHVFHKVLIRPWSLLAREPIVLLLSLYQSIALATIYLLFAAFPIVYEQARHWPQDLSGLAFLGVFIGELLGWACSIWDDRVRFRGVSRRSPSGFAPPEERLSVSRVGAFAIPIGLFWFAWTNGPNIHFLVSIAAGIPLGAGIVIILIGIQNYLVDAYTLYAASALAGGVVLRSVLAAAFTLFTPQMYQNLGIHWGSSIPAFLSIACLPLPALFYKYGEAIRARCRYAREADAVLRKLRHQGSGEPLTVEKEKAVVQDPKASA